MGARFRVRRRRGAKRPTPTRLAPSRTITCEENWYGGVFWCPVSREPQPKRAPRDCATHAGARGTREQNRVRPLLKLLRTHPGSIKCDTCNLQIINETLRLLYNVSYTGIETNTLIPLKNIRLCVGSMISTLNIAVGLVADLNPPPQFRGSCQCVGSSVSYKVLCRRFY